jgi:sulfur-oxidizing protein SoxY
MTRPAGLIDRRSVTAGLALSGLLGRETAAAAEDAQRAVRWKSIQTAVFGTRPVQPGGGVIVLEAPDRALDAAFVPVTLTMPGKDRVSGVHLFIDDNPSPYATHVVFGPAADPSSIRLQVRVDSYTDMHAVAETADGRLYQTSRFIKAAGGCSAPLGLTEAEASKGMGDMSLAFADRASSPVEAVLSIRHPNFNGMQMDPFTKGYTPARFIREVKVSSGGETIFAMTADISLSANPVIGFRFAPQGAAPVEVSAVDSQGGRWRRSFDTPLARR